VGSLQFLYHSLMRLPLIFTCLYSQPFIFVSNFVVLTQAKKWGYFILNELQIYITGTKQANEINGIEIP